MKHSRLYWLSALSLAASVGVVSSAIGGRPVDAQRQALRASTADMSYVAGQIKQYTSIPRWMRQDSESRVVGSQLVGYPSSFIDVS